MTRVVKMFNKNQQKLKARGWATQTELVCQDHNRGFVISLYIIFSHFLLSLHFLSLVLVLLLYHHNPLRDPVTICFITSLQSCFN